MSSVSSVNSSTANQTTSTSSTQKSSVNLISGLTSSTLGSTTRITGMYSGLDTDTLVQDMLYPEQQKLDSIYKDETLIQWKYQAYTDVKTQLSDFRNKYMSATSDANVYSTSTYKAYTVNLAANNYFSVTAGTGAVTGSHTVTSATMATAATLSGTKHRSQAAGVEGTAGANMDATVTGSKKLQADAGDVALKDLKYSDGTSVFTFADDSDKLSFSVNGKTFVFDQDETMNDVMTEVNGDSTANATMTLNADGTMTVKSDTLGTASALNLANVAGSNSFFGTDGALGISAGAASKSSAINGSMTLEDIAAATGKNLGFDDSGNVSFTINGKSFTFNKTQTLNEVMSTINSDGTAKANMSYDASTDSFMIRSTVTGDSSSLSLANVGDGKFFSTSDATSPIGIAAGTTTKQDPVNASNDSILRAAAKMGVNLTLDADNMFSFSVNGKKFSFDPTTTSVATMIQKVNSDPDAQVTMSYSNITDSFVIQSDATGASTSLTAENGAGVNAFGDGGLFGMSSTTANGTDAVIQIDGETVKNSSNSFTLDGMAFKLTGNFDSAAEGSTQQAVSYSVSQDIDSVVNKVKAFIKDYNSLVESLNSTISQQKDYDYPILSESDHSKLSDSDQTTWDTKAKQGLLHSDSDISEMLSEMRQELYKKVGDTGLSAADIGLTTGSWSDNGQITLDEDKFRSALQKNPDAVSQVMVGSSTSTDKATKEQYSGLITSFYGEMTTYANNLTNTTLTNLSNSLSTDKSKYDDQVSKMQDKQTQYYNQFAAMEQALAQYNSQMGWLNSQLGSGS